MTCKVEGSMLAILDFHHQAVRLPSQPRTLVELFSSSERYVRLALVDAALAMDRRSFGCKLNASGLLLSPLPALPNPDDAVQRS